MWVVPGEYRLVEIGRVCDERQLAAYASVQLFNQARAGEKTRVKWGDKERLKIRELGIFARFTHKMQDSHPAHGSSGSLQQRTDA